MKAVINVMGCDEGNWDFNFEEEISLFQFKNIGNHIWPLDL